MPAEIEMAELTIEWAVLNEADPARRASGFFADRPSRSQVRVRRWSRSSR